MDYKNIPVSLTLNRILIATDFSPAGHAAFEAAMQLCLSSNASLYALNVFEYASITPPEFGGELLELDTFYQDAARSMDSLIQEARSRGVRCEGKIAGGVVHAAILDSVASEGVGLVVLGTRAIHGFERLVFGSTAEAVLRRADCPVYTVGPQAASQEGQTAPGNGSVVFATDFHDTTTAVISEAAEFALLLHLPLHCLHVLPRGAEDGNYKSVIPIIIMEALQHLAETLDRNFPPPTCAVTYGSEISNAIVEYARQHNAKLIVLGVRRASLIQSHVPAHIAYRMIAEAPCPVLTMAFPLPAQAPRTISNTALLKASQAGSALARRSNDVLV